MDKLAQYRSQFGTINIVVTVYLKQNGLIIDVITPNEHLGGIGVGIPYSRTNGTTSANFHCLSFPGHRDAELAGNLAQIISKITKMKTVVILGIHIPDITKSQVKDINFFFKKWFNDIGTKLLKLSSLNSDIKAR